MSFESEIKNRHSVRRYDDRPIPQELIDELYEEIKQCNAESGLNIQLITNEEKAFGGMMAHYGKFSGVKNYIALVGANDKEFDEKSGYYGERLVLKAQQLGLNTCWVALSFSRSKCTVKVQKGEKLGCVISIGYGLNQGKERKSKTSEQVSNCSDRSPEWFKKGVEAALLAPTAVNQQRFMLTLDNGKVKAEATGGPYCKVDLGIIKFNFEAAAGKENFEWM